MKKKEAIKILKDFHDKSALFSIRTALETLHPEFKESEDELTWLKKYIEEEAYSLSMDIRGSEDRIKLKKLQKSLAWLEKQGESNPYSGVSFEYNGHAYEMCARNNGVEILIDCKLKAFVSLDKSFVYPDCPQPILTPKSALEAIKEDKIDNQNCVKPIVEPKFKVGDWIIHKDNKHIPIKIIEKIGMYYRTVDTVNYHHNLYIDYANENYRLWATQDAKDGDVLINDFHLIFVFKEIKNNMYVSHCSIIDRGNDVIVNSVAEREVGDVNLVKCQPATKEQYDLLFSKMKEAGYEWDAENKELKKIEQKPVVIIPKFRIGDNIKTTNEEPLTITKIDGKGYWSEDLLVCGFDDAAKWELVEQKPADKVEPKFKVDDWVVYYRNDSSREVLQVYDIRDDRYYFTDNVHFSWSVKECDEKSHLWTIEDAKPGDVLACENGWTCIFKCLNDNLFSSYCFMDGEGWFCEDGGQGHTLDERICGEIHPATNEQRDTLMKAMADAGYIFDFEKKELKKIEQKSAEWSEEDERIRKTLIDYFNTCAGDYYGELKLSSILAWLEKQENCEYIRKDWLEHIKQSWYKEGFIDGKYTPKELTINDAATLNELIDFLENGTVKLQHDLTLYANWLKTQFSQIEK